MALNMSSLKTTVGLTKRFCPTFARTANYSSWEPKELETHTGQVSLAEQCPAMNDIVRLTVTQPFWRCNVQLYIVLQKWEKNDYRLARYIDKEKQVNQSFAIDLINQVPPKECIKSVVYCDGGGGPLGHPKVYINLVNSFF